MELKLSDKTLRKILIGIAVAAVILLIVNGLYRRSKYQFPPPTTSTDTSDTSLRTELTACETAYSTAYIAANGDAAAIATAASTLRTCVSGKVTTYVQTKCPYTNGIRPGDTDGGPATTAITAAWNAYQTNISAIRQAYASFINTPADATTTTLTIDIVRAARKADLTGATRKYLSTVCPSSTGPGFYTPSDYGTGATTTVTYPDPISSKYNQWQVYTAAPSGTTLTYGFYPGLVTRAKIAAWAVGAGVLPTDGTAPTSGLAASGSKYSSAPTSGATSGIPNWVVARDFGPGTVGSAVPVSYTGGAAPKKADIDIPVDGYTYAG